MLLLIVLGTVKLQDWIHSLISQLENSCFIWYHPLDCQKLKQSGAATTWYQQNSKERKKQKLLAPDTIGEYRIKKHTMDTNNLRPPDACTSDNIDTNGDNDVNKNKKDNYNNASVPVPKDLCYSVYLELEAVVSEHSSNDAVRKHLVRRVWDGVRERYGGLPFYRKMYQQIHHKLDRFLDASNLAAKRHMRKLGYRPVKKMDGTVEWVLKRRFSSKRLGGALRSKTEEKEDNDFIEDVPYAILGDFQDDEELMLRLVDLDGRLRERFVRGGRTKYHNGVSLGYTAVSGGSHARNGWSGSYHANQNLLDDPELQQEVIEICCAIVIKAFGGSEWYKKVMAFYDKEENKERKGYLLPGTPCTGIWWSRDGREENMHVDRNAYGPAFVFCTGDYKGGELTFLHQEEPGLCCKHKLCLGEVIGGRWSRGLHYVQNVFKSDDRTAIVMYGEYRVLEKETYKHVVNKNTEVMRSV